MLRLLHRIINEDNFLSLAGNLVIAVFGFAGFALLARSLSPDDFAQWVLFISGGSLIEMLRYGITNNGLVRFLGAADDKKRSSLIGSNIVLSASATLLIISILLLVNWLFYDYLKDSVYAAFFAWYPLLAVVNLPWNNEVVLQQAKMSYNKILRIRAINSTLFFGFLVVNLIVFRWKVVDIIIAFIIFNLITSVICIVNSWDGLKYVSKTDKESLSTLLHFGKFSTFTLIGTNLLRNADVLIISISPFGSAAVALFSIPLKLTELQQIPLRSFAATAFPKMSIASIEGKIHDLKNLFHVYTGAITYLFVFLSFGTIIFAREFVILISGYEYLNVAKHGIDIVMIVRIFAIYGLLLPLDRMTGIGLDSLNKPNINALKVFIMLGANIIGDIVAIYIFNSIELVAVATLVFTTTGIAVGWYFIEKTFKISPSLMIKSTNLFYKNLLGQKLSRSL